MNRLQLLFVAGSLALAGAVGVSFSSVEPTASDSGLVLEAKKKKKKNQQSQRNQRNQGHRPTVQKHTTKMKGVEESKQTLMSDKEKAAKMAKMLKARGVNPTGVTTRPTVNKPAGETKAEQMKRLVEEGQRAIGR